MQKYGLTAVFLAASLAMTPAYAAVVVPGSGGINAGALIRIDGGGLLESSSNSDGFIGAPRSLKAGLTVSSSNPLGQRGASTTSVTANFLSPDAGSVRVLLARDFSGPGAISGSQNNQGNTNGINFFYTFTPSSNAILNLISNVTVQGGHPFGFQGFILRSNGVGVLGQFNAINPTASGTASVALTSGIAYTLSIENASNISGGLPSIFNGSTTGDFSFSIKAVVPEPASWAMMIIGFGFIGAAARRRTQRLRLTWN